MRHLVTCSCCHRVEVWHDLSDVDPTTAGPHARRVEVSVEGGQRVPSEDPDLARGRSALAAVRGSRGPVVGRCVACDQLLHAEAEAAMAPIPVAIPLGEEGGEVLIHGAVVRGPGGVMSADDAEALLEAQLGRRWYEGLGRDLGKVPLFLVLVPILFGWIMAGLFVASFLASVIQGPAPAVQGSPGYYQGPAGGW